MLRSLPRGYVAIQVLNLCKRASRERHFGRVVSVYGLRPSFHALYRPN